MHVFRLLAKRDANAAAYLQRTEQVHMEGQQMVVNFVSPGNVGTVLTSRRLMTVDKIVHSICRQSKACIIFDSTLDYNTASVRQVYC